MQTLEAKEGLGAELQGVRGQLAAEQEAARQLQADLAEQQRACQQLSGALASESGSSSSLQSQLDAQSRANEQQLQVGPGGSSWACCSGWDCSGLVGPGPDLKLWYTSMLCAASVSKSESPGHKALLAGALYSQCRLHAQGEGGVWLAKGKQASALMYAAWPWACLPCTTLSCELACRSSRASASSLLKAARQLRKLMPGAVRSAP